MDTELTRPPILVLGTSERVGSNWVLDSLRASTTQHNEPLRRQLGREHPLAPLSNAPTGHVARSPLATHWAEAFRRNKYHGGPHVIKETNLYFTAPGFLSMFPDAPVVVVSRSPPREIADRLNRWVAGLGDRGRPPWPSSTRRRSRSCHSPIADLGPMYEPAPGNPSSTRRAKVSLNPRSGSSAVFTNSTPRIGRVSNPSAISPRDPPTLRTSKVM